MLCLVKCMFTSFIFKSYNELHGTSTMESAQKTNTAGSVIERSPVFRLISGEHLLFQGHSAMTDVLPLKTQLGKTTHTQA